MRTNSINKQNVQYRMWNDEQCQRIIDSSYRILERTGCIVKNDRARDLLKNAGCTIDGEHVYIPSGLMQWAIDRAPSSINLYSREGKPAMRLSPYEVNYGPAITCTHIIDYKTNEVRRGTQKDAANIAQLIDNLPNIAWASALISISDVDQNIADIWEVYTLLQNTTKPFMFWAQNIENLKYQFQMMETVAGGPESFRAKPFAINLICPMDPLVHTNDGLEQIIFMAEKGCPSVYIAGIGFGLTGPITLAGSISLGIADTLVGLLISQLTNPGVPFVVSKFNDSVDMKTVSMAHSRPEMITAQCATADVFRYIDIPFCSNFGNTDSGIFDEITIFDKSIQLYNCMLSGTNMSFAIGAYQAGNLSSLEDIVLCNELIEYSKVLVKGIEIDEECLAEDVIHEVGPGGDFVSEEHTLDHLYDSYVPDLLTPYSYDQWKQSDQTGTKGKIQKRIDTILDKNIAKPLNERTIQQLNKILEEATKEFSGRTLTHSK